MNNTNPEGGGALGTLLDQYAGARKTNAASSGLSANPLTAASPTPGGTVSALMAAGLSLLDLLTGRKASAIAGAGLNWLDMLRAEDAAILKPAPVKSVAVNTPAPLQKRPAGK
jgi:hypothetical protein